MKLTGKPNELIQELLKLDREKVYSMEIKEPKSKRSLQQNSYMWKLISQIAERQFQDEMEVYCQALEQANAKYEYLLGLETVEEELKKNFRAVKVVRPEYHNGNKFIVYKCFIGSSKMDTKEMTQLLEIVVRWASELGIPTLDDKIIEGY